MTFVGALLFVVGLAQVAWAAIGVSLLLLFTGRLLVLTSHTTATEPSRIGGRTLKSAALQVVGSIGWALDALGLYMLGGGIWLAVVYRVDAASLAFSLLGVLFLALGTFAIIVGKRTPRGRSVRVPTTPR